jgi:CxxC-x17-CxxC domain-containing protein
MFKGGEFPKMYQDKTLTCADCGNSFVFTAAEQEFYAQKGFANEPKRCPDCRRNRKDQMGGRRGGNGGGRGFGGPKEMFDVVCSNCGKAAQVPFKPRGDRPVLCDECFKAQRG